jgi:predicted phosphoribosyltransferase
MYFTDRIGLGRTLLNNVRDLRNKDAVVLCLKDSSLLTCLTMAMRLRAWVYPLLSVPVFSNDVQPRLLGAYTEDGDFCLNPELGQDDVSQLSPEDRQCIDSNRQVARRQIGDLIETYEMSFNKQAMQGRDVIIVGDVVTDPLVPAVAAQTLKSIRAKSLTVLVGNATPSAVSLLRMLGTKTVILDVLSGIAFDDNHYFEHADAYTPQQKRGLTKHIAAYWQ